MRSHLCELMDGLVDIYMPDFKFWQPETALRLAKARDYPDVARAAILEMHRQVGPLVVGPDGLARRGVLIRHLVMPGQLDETRAILGWIADTLGPDAYVNLMGQYRPEYKVPGASSAQKGGNARYADIDRRPLTEEMREAHRIARAVGLTRLDRR